LSEDLRVARRAGVVGAATMLSRVLGLIREQVMATLFGAGLATDAFNVAFRIPNLLRDLFAEGAMSAAFVPTFTETRAKGGDDQAWALARQLMAWLIAVLAVICALGFLFAPELVRLFAPGFTAVPGKHELTVLLTRVMLPFLPAVALAAAAMGLLNARGRFGVPALAPALLNVGMIAGGLLLLPLCDAWGQPRILAMAIGLVIGGAAQFLVQLPALSAEGFRFRLEWPRAHPGVARMAALMGPATIGLAATQINMLVTTVIASLLPQGSVSWLWYAFRLMQLPIGVFGVALATVSLPGLSQAAVERDMPALKATLSSALRLVFALTVPAALWLAVMAGPLVAMLYEHGRFGPADTTQTAGALLMYCIGLPAFAATGVLTRAFYALGETGTPVRASFVAVGVNLALNLLWVGPLRFLGLDHLGLALASSVTSITNLVQLAWALRRRIGPLEGGRILDTAARVMLAALLALAPSAVMLMLWNGRWQGHLLLETAMVVVSLVAFLGLGLLAMRLLRVSEVDALRALFTAVLARGR
jgi:putative peptidoglycan lipid II flippase